MTRAEYARLWEAMEELGAMETEALITEIEES